MVRRPIIGGVAPVERRPVGRSEVYVSALGVPVESLLSPASASEDDSAAAAGINLLRDSGVTYFDAGPPSSVSERVLGEALRSDGAQSIEIGSVLTGDAEQRPTPPSPLDPSGPFAARRHVSAFGPRPDSWSIELNDAVGRSTRRLRRPALDIAWIDASDAHVLTEPAVAAAMKELRASHRVGVWGVRSAGTVPDAAFLATATGAGAEALAIPFHLINAPETAGLVAAVRAFGASVIALDPHANGLLDGGILHGGALRSRAGPPRPVIWSELRRGLEPVARLGFLTSGRRRTLGQAALQYVLGTPGVASVLPDWREPATFAEWLGALQREALTVVERRAVEGRGSGSANHGSGGPVERQDPAGP